MALSAFNVRWQIPLKTFYCSAPFTMQLNLSDNETAEMLKLGEKKRSLSIIYAFL